MTVKINNNQIGQIMAQAWQSDDENVQAEAWSQFHDFVVDQMRADYEEYAKACDKQVLMQRGYRQLTTVEQKWYEKLISALKSDTPKQKFAEIIGSDIESDLMPETILEDVYKNLTEDHPLLSKVSFAYTAYVTKWILSDPTKQKAVWGSINGEILGEITSAFKTVDVKQHKLTAFAFIEKDMLELGATFLDNYIRTLLTEALANGLEYGIVMGNGAKEPIGMVRSIKKGVSFNSDTGYPEKDAVKVTDFSVASYGNLVAKLVKTESGAMRKFSGVTMIVNMVDYLTKIMPATTVLTTAGTYARDLFPFPTEVIPCNYVPEGTAILGLLDEYSAFAGGQKNGVIEVSDDYKFIEDLRYFKIKQFATGRAFDDTSFMKLDISELDPSYVTVKVVDVPEV